MAREGLSVCGLRQLLITGAQLKGHGGAYEARGGVGGG